MANPLRSAWTFSLLGFFCKDWGFFVLLKPVPGEPVVDDVEKCTRTSLRASSSNRMETSRPHKKVSALETEPFSLPCGYSHKVRAAALCKQPCHCRDCERGAPSRPHQRFQQRVMRRGWDPSRLDTTRDGDQSLASISAQPSLFPAGCSL